MLMQLNRLTKKISTSPPEHRGRAEDWARKCREPRCGTRSFQGPVNTRSNCIEGEREQRLTNSEDRKVPPARSKFGVPHRSGRQVALLPERTRLLVDRHLVDGEEVAAGQEQIENEE